LFSQHTPALLQIIFCIPQLVGHDLILLAKVSLFIFKLLHLHLKLHALICRFLSQQKVALLVIITSLHVLRIAEKIMKYGW